MGASTPGTVHSTEAVVEHMAKMTGWSARNDTEVQRTKEEVLNRKDEQGVPKREWSWSSWGCNMHWMTLACPFSMVEAHEVSFDLCSIVVQSPLHLPNM